MTTNEAWDETEWAEYRVLCSDGAERHRPERPTIRTDVLGKAARMDERVCGPHRIEQRHLIRSVGPWTPLLAGDPQTEIHEAICTIARMVACPSCPAVIDQDCMNLTLLRSRNEVKPVKWPHSERLDLVVGSAAPPNG